MQSAVEREYQSLTPLEVRIQTHHRYSEASHDVEADVIAAAGIGPEDAVLDVGPGTGSFLGRLAADRAGSAGRAGSADAAPLTALDFSAQAVAACAAIPGVLAVRGDAQRVPFAAGSFDVVTSRHMLYHLDDPLGAIAEAGRVLRPGGRFTAVVNRESPYPGMIALLDDVLLRNGITPPPAPGHRVHGGNLPILMAHGLGVDLDRVEVVRRDNALVFPGPEPVVAYLTSILTLHGVPDDAPVRAAVVADLDAAARAAHRALPGGLWREPKGYVIATASP